MWKVVNSCFSRACCASALQAKNTHISHVQLFALFVIGEVCNFAVSMPWAFTLAEAGSGASLMATIISCGILADLKASSELRFAQHREPGFCPMGQLSLCRTAGGSWIYFDLLWNLDFGCSFFSICAFCFPAFWRATFRTRFQVPRWL